MPVDPLSFFLLSTRRRAARAVLWAALAGPALAQMPADSGRQGKLLLTGGVSSIDGAAGGGLTPWAVTGGYATGRQGAATAAATRVITDDYGLDILGAAVAVGEHLEVSVARQDFDTGVTGRALGLPGLQLKLDIVGVKVPVAGDAVLDADTPMPQVAVGVEFKRVDAGGLALTLDALGADEQGVDVYVSATKLLLAPGVLLNGTLRLTRANQNGLLGFGGTGHRAYRLQPEVSVAWLLRRDLAVGVEFRAQPDNLNPSLLGAGLAADDWKDLFIAWAPGKHFSLTLARVDLGRIVPATAPRRQRGWYVSAQIAP